MGNEYTILFMTLNNYLLSLLGLQQDFSRRFSTPQSVMDALFLENLLQYLAEVNKEQRFIFNLNIL